VPRAPDSAQMPADPPDLSSFPDGTALSQIAAALGITVREVRQRLVDPRREPVQRRVSAGPRRRLSDPARDAEIVGLYRALEPIQEIARSMHLSTMTVMSVLDRSGIERRSRGFRRAKQQHPGPPKRVDGEAIVALHRKGLIHKRIADELGCGVTTVRERLHEAGIRKVLADPGRDGEIARRWADGQTLASIAAAVGMSKGGIQGAVRRLRVEGRRAGPVVTS